MSPAWTYYMASRAGLSRQEAAILPLGAVRDQINVWLIFTGRAKESHRSSARDVFDF